MNKRIAGAVALAAVIAFPLALYVHHAAAPEVTKAAKPAPQIPISTPIAPVVAPAPVPTVAEPVPLPKPRPKLRPKRIRHARRRVEYAPPGPPLNCPLTRFAVDHFSQGTIDALARANAVTAGQRAAGRKCLQSDQRG